MIVTKDELATLYKAALKNSKNQLSSATVHELIADCSEGKAKEIIQKFVASRMVSDVKFSGSSEFVITLREQDLALKLKTLDGELYGIFCSIEKAHTNGIGSRELLRAVNEKQQQKSRGVLTATKINQSLKSLQNNKFIKEVKSIQNRSRKIYVVANLEPDESIVGGIFYKDGVFDDALVEAYRERILHYLGSHRMSKMRDITEFLKASGFKEDLSEMDLEKIFHSLVLDQLLSPCIKDTELYYALAQWPDFEEVERLPCVSCPMQSACYVEDVDRFDSILLRQTMTHADKFREEKALRQQGAKHQSRLLADADSLKTAPSNQTFSSKISPATCPYFSQWLGLTCDPCVPKPEEDTTPD